jgi:hypothetical protein
MLRPFAGDDYPRAGMMGSIRKLADECAPVGVGEFFEPRVSTDNMRDLVLSPPTLGRIGSSDSDRPLDLGDFGWGPFENPVFWQILRHPL